MEGTISQPQKTVPAFRLTLDLDRSPLPSRTQMQPPHPSASNTSSLAHPEALTREVGQAGSNHKIQADDVGKEHANTQPHPPTCPCSQVFVSVACV